MNDDFEHRVRKRIEDDAHAILRDLSKPDNMDLLIAVHNQDDAGIEDSFMFGFTPGELVSFSQFVRLCQIADRNFGVVDPRPMLQRYEDYREKWGNPTLNESQAARFNAIVAQCNETWSGWMYGAIMRRVQQLLEEGEG